jgi:hypothetical protein
MPSGPSVSVLKRLFAKSGNQCAFPKCTVNIVQGDILLGEVCHIKGAKHEAPRHDKTQTSEERHAFANLLILCPNHHGVIDDDDETYDVERLTRMKNEHEARVHEMSADAAETGAILLAGPAVISSNQSGGITARAVHVNTMHLSHSVPATPERETAATEKLWTVCCELRKVHHDIVFAESILITSEIDGYFQTAQWPPSLKSVMHYSSYDWSAKQLKNAGAIDVDQYRLFVSDRLWSIFFIIRALYGRLGVLYHFSFEEGAYRDWRKDGVFTSHAKALLGEAFFQQFKDVPFHALSQILGSAEAEFLKEARSNRRSAE